MSPSSPDHPACTASAGGRQWLRRGPSRRRWTPRRRGRPLADGLTGLVPCQASLAGYPFPERAHPIGRSILGVSGKRDVPPAAWYGLASDANVLIRSEREPIPAEDQTGGEAAQLLIDRLAAIAACGMFHTGCSFSERVRLTRRAGLECDQPEMPRSWPRSPAHGGAAGATLATLVSYGRLACWSILKPSSDWEMINLFR